MAVRPRIERVEVGYFAPSYAASGAASTCPHLIEHRQFIQASDSSDFYICKGCGLRMEIQR